MKKITHAIETIEVGTSKIDGPILLDLNQIFGAIGLSYRIAVLSYGILNVSRSSSSGKVYLSAGENAEVGGRTRMVMRASDSSGCSVAARFKVQIVSQLSSSACAA